MAAYALGMIGPDAKEALPKLQSMATTDRGVYEGKSVRDTALKAIEKIGGEDS